MNHLAFELPGQGLVVTGLDHAVERLFFVSLGLRFGQLFLQLLDLLVLDVPAWFLVRFQKDQIISPSIVLETLFRFLQPRFDARELLRKPVRGLLRCRPPSLQVLLHVVFRQAIRHARCKHGIVGIELNGYQPAPVDRIYLQPAFKTLQHSPVDCSIRASRSGGKHLRHAGIFVFAPAPRPPLRSIELRYGI